MFRLWSEWDIDESDIVFVSEEAGMRWLKDNLHVQDMARDDNQTVDEFLKSCFHDCLMEFKRVKVFK